VSPDAVLHARGKVRDVYEAGPDRLLIVATDRISAFDWVLPSGIPDKGRVLTQLSRFWFEYFRNVPNHLISCEVDDFDLPRAIDRSPLVGRSMLVRKTSVVPIECVVRGYLSGSAWSEYQKTGTVCGIELPTGLKESDKLPGAVFTPATKAEQGLHDENISYDDMCARVGRELAKQHTDAPSCRSHVLVLSRCRSGSRSRADSGCTASPDLPGPRRSRLPPIDE